MDHWFSSGTEGSQLKCRTSILCGSFLLGMVTKLYSKSRSGMQFSHAEEI